jgi:hypothetical protein
VNDKRNFLVLFVPLLAIIFMCLCAPVAFADGPETNSLPSASDVLESAPDSSSGISDMAASVETSEARPLLSTPLDSYSVVEGLLFLIFLILLFLVLIRIFGF